jgi:hypothetical protein
MIYTYCAEYLCEDCGNNVIRERLKEYHEVQAGVLPDDPLQRQYKENDASTVPEADCRRCGHKWIPTVEEFNESVQRAYWLVCPHCESRYGAFDQYTYDSDDFPKGDPNDWYSDSPEFCGHCQTFLENDLTSDGVEYTLENFADNEEVRRFYFWIDWPSENEEEEEDAVPDDN